MTGPVFGTYVQRLVSLRLVSDIQVLQGARPVTKWGILGTAKIAAEQHIPAVHLSQGGVVQAVASRSLEKAKAFATSHKIIHAVEGYEALLEREDVDAVYIPLITSDHTEWTIKSLQAGKHVLCEKPMGMTASDIDAIEEASAQTGKIAVEAYMVAHHPQWQKVRGLLQDNAIGKLQHVEGSFCYFNRDPANMRNIVEQGGGALRDIGVYPTVTTLFATGAAPQQINCQITRDATFGTDIHAHARVLFDDFSLTFYVSTQLAMRQQMTFHGSDGLITVHTPFNARKFGEACITLRKQNGLEATTWRFPNEDQYLHQVNAFHDHIQGKAGYPVSFDLSRNVQRIIDACFACEN